MIKQHLLQQQDKQKQVNDEYKMSSKQFEELKGHIEKLPEIDFKKVKHIKQQIAENNYHISDDKIAAFMLTAMKLA